MRNNFTFEFLLNPFTRIAGWKAFFIGLLFALLAGLGGLKGIWFDGVLDAHPAPNIPFYWAYVMQAVNIISIAAVMWVVAIIISRNFRFVDILGTMTLARAPMLLMVPLIALLSLAAGSDPLVKSTLTLVAGLLVLIVWLWYIVLMYNGMRVSCNVKGWKFAVLFAVGIVIAETVSKVLLSLLMKTFFVPPAA